MISRILTPAHTTRFRFIHLLALTILFMTQVVSEIELRAAPPVFEKDVQPIFVSRCGKCHTDKVQKAELNLTSAAAIRSGGESGDVFVASNTADSLLFEMILDGSMPPEDEPQLTKSEIAVIRNWISSGAKFTTTIAKSKAVTHDDVIQSILRRCWMCHGPEYQRRGVDLRTFESILKGGDNGPVLVAGAPGQSLMVQRVVEKKCPPKADIGEAGIEPMTPEELVVLQAWIKQGAQRGESSHDSVSKSDTLIDDKDRDFWSFQTPHKTAPPQTATPDLVRNPIDAFLLAKLNKQGLSFSAPAEKATVIRRVTFSLTGLPAEPEFVQRFLDDERPQAFESMVDELLASPRYGEKWGRFWLDLAGYADSEGKRNADMIRPYAWKYRDWVVRAFNADKPYDQFLIEQLAGDELVDWANSDAVTPDVIDKLVATGFLRMAPDGTSADPVNRFSDRLEVITDEIDVLGRSLMGLTLNCARCHSHKYDPIPQLDYYRMVAVFKGAYDEYDWLTPQPFGNQWNKAQRRHLEIATTDQLKNIAAFNDSINKQISALQTKVKATKNKPDKKKIQKQINGLKAKLKSPEKIRALWDRGRPSPTYVYRRGDDKQPSHLVEPGVPAVLSTRDLTYEVEPPNHSSPKTGRRLAFARWLTRNDHPLTARVIVNRIWQQHFGRGIVSSLDNFGALGTAPSHPALLDWLAVEFVEHDWSIKHIHRLILNSTAWRQSSKIRQHHEKLDPDNVLLSRMPMRRLQAEEVRDAILLVAGRLKEAPFGQPDAVEVRGDGLVTSKPTNGMWRRSVYVRQRRKEMPTLFETFDLPQMAPNCTERKASTIVTQPLLLMNNRLIHDLAASFAQRVSTEAGTADEPRMAWAFELIAGRKPNNDEMAAAVEVLAQLKTEWANSGNNNANEKAFADFCHVLLNSANFLYVD